MRGMVDATRQTGNRWLSVTPAEAGAQGIEAACQARNPDALDSRLRGIDAGG